MIDKYHVQVYPSNYHLDLMLTIDLLTSKMGSGIVKLASEGTEKSWKMRQNYSTPCYTTRMEDILMVR